MSPGSQDLRVGISDAPTCPYCGKPAQLVDSAIIYGKSYGMIWDCRPCDAYVGVHKNDSACRPLGRLANAELRMWKKNVHAVFDVVWQGAIEDEITANGGLPMKGMKQRHRTRAYARLADALRIPREQCHIGMFDVAQCKQAIRICAAWRQQGESNG